MSTTTMSVAQAKAKLSELVKRAEAGEEVIITRYDKPVARLVALPEVRKRDVQLGWLEGQAFFMADDFDAELDDFAEYGP